jgi:WG containing repeat
MLLVRTATITIVLLLLAANAAGQNPAAPPPKPPARSGNAIPTYQADGTPCLFDFERGEVSDCVRKSAKGALTIAPAFLKELSFDAHGFAAVRSPTEGWMYVNRRGRVVITGVPVMDNWADSFHDGLVRIVRNGKYGFANRRGQVVIYPIYDGAMNFEKGGAAVCKGCETKCVGRECEYQIFSGGQWFRISTKGIVLTRLHPEEAK